MFPVLRCEIVVGVAVVGDGGAGEVEGSAIGGGDYFYCIWVVDVLRGADDFEGGDFDLGPGEGFEERGEVFGFEEGFVALDVDVDVGGDYLGDGVDAVGAAGQVGRGEFVRPVVSLAEFSYFVGVGGDDDTIELGAGAGGFVDPGEHRASGDGQRTLRGRRVEARRAGMTPRTVALRWVRNPL